MNIQVNKNGIWQEVTQKELVEMVRSGMIEKDTEIIFNDKQVQAGIIQGLVFPESPEEALKLVWNDSKPTISVPDGGTDDNTPLHIAVMNANIEIVDILLQNGANPHAKNLNGQTPLMLANQYGHHDIAELLAQYTSRRQRPIPPQQDFVEHRFRRPTDENYSPSQMPVLDSLPLTPQQRKSRLTLWITFYLVCFGIFTLITMFFSAASISMEANEALMSEPPEEIFTVILGLLVLEFFAVTPFLIGTAVFYGLTVAVLWREIPKEIARTTVGKAVGFSFIPFYNFYWFFVIFYGLVDDMNRTLQRSGREERFDSTFALGACIFWCAIVILDFSLGFTYLFFSLLFSMAEVGVLIAFMLYLRTQMNIFIDLKNEIMSRNVNVFYDRTV